MTDPTRPGISPWFAVYAADHERAGRPIVRDRLCGCGRGYQQHMLSERFMVAAERAGAAAAVEQAIPGLWVPVYCPSCEGRDLAYQARIVRIPEVRNT